MSKMRNPDEEFAEDISRAAVRFTSGVAVAIILLGGFIALVNHFLVG